jgi:hypothetical protein
MSNQGGVSMWQVESAIAAKVGPLKSDLHAVERRLHVLDNRLNQMETEMANIEGAVRSMHEGLRGELQSIRKGNSELLEVQQQTKKMTLEQFVAANTALTAANVQISQTNDNLGVINQTSLDGFRTLDVGIDRMAQALVQTEVIRLLHEAKEPNERVHTFAEEIEERFAKTLENVFLVRSQYDQLLGVAMNEYEAKLKVIGEHIYGMYEDDFRQFAEVPLCDPTGRRVELPISLDELRLEQRHAALESRFDKLGDELMEPILEAHRTLEHSLATRFSVPIETSEEEVAVPASLRINVDGTMEVFGGLRAESETNPTGQTQIVLKPTGERGSQAAIAARIKPVAAQLKFVELTNGERNTLKKTLERLANEGRLDPGIVPALGLYLDTHGLKVVAEQEVSAS